MAGRKGRSKRKEWLKGRKEGNVKKKEGKKN
jgi:hypothetical protein